SIHTGRYNAYILQKAWNKHGTADMILSKLGSLFLLLLLLTSGFLSYNPSLVSDLMSSPTSTSSQQVIMPENASHLAQLGMLGQGWIGNAQLSQVGDLLAVPGALG